MSASSILRWEVVLMREGVGTGMLGWEVAPTQGLVGGGLPPFPQGGLRPPSHPHPSPPIQAWGLGGGEATTLSGGGMVWLNLHISRTIRQQGVLSNRDRDG